MFINFEFDNFLSFKKKCFFNMRATKGTIHADHLNEYRLLPVSAIFGGNGSGKSNFISAIDFSKSIIVNELDLDRSLFNFKFRSKDNVNNVGRFKYTFYLDNAIYSYELKYDYYNKLIVEEKLLDCKKEKIVYSRNENKEIFINEKGMAIKEKKYLDFYLKDFEFDKKIKGTFIDYISTKDSSASKFIELMKDVYDFFDKIVIIKTYSQFVAIEKLFKNDEINIKEILSNYGFSIDDIKEMPISLNKVFDNDNDEKKKKIMDILSKEDETEYHYLVGNSPYKFTLDSDGNLKAFRILFVHKNGELFDFLEESDGTQRIFDLLPLIYLFGNKKTIFFIDELDRSLSSHLSYEFLASFLQQVIMKKNNNQIVFTTHNLQFLNFNLLRKDEICFIENDGGIEGSNVVNFNDIKFRTDMDPKAAFWNGTIGGIPKSLVNMVKKKSF